MATRLAPGSDGWVLEFSWKDRGRSAPCSSHSAPLGWAKQAGRGVFHAVGRSLGPSSLRLSATMSRIIVYAPRS